MPLTEDFHGCTCCPINPSAPTPARAGQCRRERPCPEQTRTFPQSTPKSLTLRALQVLTPPCCPLLSPACPCSAPPGNCGCLGGTPCSAAVPLSPELFSPAGCSQSSCQASSLCLSTLGTPSSIWGHIPWWHHTSPGSSTSSALLLT